jgi:signal transduction histidine kinase/CheY-like chemotaxis protein
MQLLGEETMNTMQEAVTSSLTESELVFTNVAMNVENMLAENESNEAILAFLRSANTYFTTDRSVISNFLKTYAYIRGEFLDGSGWVPPDDYYPPSRPWYIGAVENGNRMFLSDPYLDAETGGMCITFSQQVFDRAGNSMGIVALDIKLDRISEYIAQQKITLGGYGVLLDDSKIFVVHRDEDLIGVKMSDAGEGYALLEDMLVRNEVIAATRFTDIDDVDSIAFFRTIFNGWEVGIIIPRDSYYEQVRDMGRVLTILGVILMVLLSYILVRTRAEKIRSEEESLSKSGFLARMSHEMRTPMNAVIGMTRIAKTTDDPEKIEYCLNRIDNAANHLLGVINDVLDMSKIEAGKLELSETEFLFSDMIEQVVSVVDVRIEEKHQNFTIEVDPGIPEAVISDRQRLAQVITNLVGNANKFTSEGGNIKLSVKAEKEKEEQVMLKVEVSDDGIGISKEQQSKLFQSFEQADGSISRKYGGTGLGLAISKKIINIMDGDMWVESEPGQGARFIFTVFVGKGDSDRIDRNKQTVDDESYADIFIGKRILLVEDIEINREILIALLEETGVEIDCAENGRTAVQMFSEAPGNYDLILMDLQMPIMNGYTATKIIRSMEIPSAKTIPIIAMTANVFKEDIEKCIEAGMNSHIGKPININEMMETIGEYI